jgi:predicted MFS family arabinose efflux permease
MKNFLRLYLDSYRGLSGPSWMLALVMLINRSGAMVVPFLGVYMTQSLKFELKETGTVLSCFGLGAVTGAWIGGLLTDKVGHFKIQVCSLFLSVPVFCLLPSLKTPETLAAGVFLLSLITETFRPANSVSLASYAKPENITKAFSLNRMAINLGFSIGPALGGFLAAISYQWLFYGNAVGATVAGILFFLYFYRMKSRAKKADTPEVAATEEAGPQKSPWRDAPFLLFCLLCCAYSIVFFQLLSTLPLFYRKVHLLTEKEIGVLLAFSGFIVFLLEMLLVHIAERRFSSAQVIVFGTFLCGVSFMLLLFTSNHFILYLGMIVLSISEILAMPFMATVVMKRATTQKRGSYMGVNSLAFSAAHIVSPYVGTRIADAYGFNTLWLATGAMATVTALGFWWVMKRM